jgi:hypothetical protein
MVVIMPNKIAQKNTNQIKYLYTDSFSTETPVTTVCIAGTHC